MRLKSSELFDILLYAFSSLFLGIRFATEVGEVTVAWLDYTFSSLFLGIRFATHSISGQQLHLLYFQFPFPRDSLCDNALVCERESTSLYFQFPFPRDSLCDRSPFCVSLTGRLAFSSLFLGIRFATLARVAMKSLSWPFSSLFLGIRFATATDSGCGHIQYAFQFPFPRDSLCDSPYKASILHKSFATWLQLRGCISPGIRMYLGI